MNSFPRIQRFKIRMNNGQTIHQTASNLQELDNLIQMYGREYISKIQFIFQSPPDIKERIVLRNITDSNNRFSGEFICYNSQDGQALVITLDEKIIHYSVVLVTLHKGGNLDNTLLPLIVTRVEEISYE